MNNKMKILILPGDGVGPEITLEARNALIEYFIKDAEIKSVS